MITYGKRQGCYRYCEVMHVGHKLNTKYYMNEQDGNMELSAVHEEKDLGVFYIRFEAVYTVYKGCSKGKKNHWNGAPKLQEVGQRRILSHI